MTRMMAEWRRWAAVSFVVWTAGCGSEVELDPAAAAVEDLPGYQTRMFALEAPCTVNVDGFGPVDIEEEYIPNVVACENGGAPPEALKAQAVQARGFVYYKLFVAGATSLSNSQGDQVYRCAHQPNGAGPEHLAAARATRGQYLTFDGAIIAPFYVAGNRPPNPDASDPVGSCRGDGGTGDLGTEHYVTYNWGQTACDVEMSSIGWTPSDCTRNPHNRGCASQNGESCLANLGWSYQDMVKYYYGDDIELVASTGQCGGTAPDPLTDEDRFCVTQADGWSCMDASTRVRCAGGGAAENEVCTDGCAGGACQMPTDPNPNPGTTDDCDGLEDGTYCLGTTEAITCGVGDVVTREACSDGCILGGCLMPGSEPAANSGAGDPSTDPSASGGPPATVAPTSGFPALVSNSQGSVGGCSSAGSAGAGPWWLALGVLGLVRRRR